METGTRARGLAGRARERALGDGVSGCRVAAAKVPGAYTQMTAPLRMPAKMRRGGARRAILIASRQILEIRLNCSQQSRKYFLIATFSGVSATAPHLANHDSRIGPPFLFDTNKAHKIIILMRALMKTKEKQFSIRYKFAYRGTGNPACAPSFDFAAAISCSVLLSGRILGTAWRNSAKQKINGKPAGDQNQSRQSRRSAIAQQDDENYARDSVAHPCGAFAERSVNASQASKNTCIRKLSPNI